MPENRCKRCNIPIDENNQYCGVCTTIIMFEIADELTTQNTEDDPDE